MNSNQVVEGLVIRPGSEARASSVPYMGNASFAERQAALELLARDSDVMRLGAPFAALVGESLAESGKARQSEMLADFKRLAPVPLAMDLLRQAAHAEGLEDHIVNIRDVRMEPVNGGLYGKGRPTSHSWAYTKRGLEQALDGIKPKQVRQGFVPHLLSLPPALRSQVVDYHAMNATEEATFNLRTGLAKVRGDAVATRRTVYAATSDKHSKEYGDDLALSIAIEEALPLGGRCRVTRDDFGAVTCIEVLWSSLERELRVGDPVMMGIKVFNSSNKGSSIVVEPFIHRARCYNLTIAYSELVKPEEWRIRHMGDVRRQIGALVRKALGVVTPFVEAFGDAYRTGFPEGKTRADVIGALVKRYELPEAFGESMRSMWNMDGDGSAGDTLAGLSNAVTRASKSMGMLEAADMERLAGRVVVQGWGAVL